MRSTIRIWVLASLIVAAGFVSVWRLSPYLPVDRVVQLENVQLILWPGSIFLLAAVPVSHSENLLLHGMALSLNILLYGILGATVWLARQRQLRWPLAGSLTLTCLAWVVVLSL